MSDSKIKAVIVDDEEKGRKLLRNLISEYCSDVEVVALADSAQAGADAIKKHKPHLIFLDIVMPNEDGFAVLSKIGGYDCEVIFTTAYDQYAIRAIRACALDYLLKPIDVDELQASVKAAQEKIREKSTETVTDERLATLLQYTASGSNLPQKIGIPTMHGVKFYQIEDIYFCKAEGNYTTIHICGNEKLELVSKTLKEFEELFNDYNFMRTHRSYLVNLSHLTEYKRFNYSDGSDGEGGCVILANKMKIPVSRDKRKSLLQRISKPF